MYAASGNIAFRPKIDRLVSVPRDIDLLSFDPKINSFQGIIVEHFYAKSGDPAARVFEILHGKTDKHINAIPAPAIAFGIGKYKLSYHRVTARRLFQLKSCQLLHSCTKNRI